MIAWLMRRWKPQPEPKTVEMKLFIELLALETALAILKARHKDEVAKLNARVEQAEAKARINHDSAKALSDELEIVKANHAARVKAHEEAEARLREVESKLAEKVRPVDDERAAALNLMLAEAIGFILDMSKLESATTVSEAKDFAEKLESRRARAMGWTGERRITP